MQIALLECVSECLCLRVDVLFTSVVNVYIFISVIVRLNLNA